MLIENPAAAGTLNHLGVEVASSADVAAASARLDAGGLAPAGEEGVTCCYAVQDKAWVHDPDGAPWEVYAVLADADTPGARPVPVAARGPGACGPAAPGGDATREACRA